MKLSINSERNTGLELLKIFALFGIVLVHVYTVFTLAKDINNGSIFFDTNTFSNITYFLFQIIISFGYLGNMIFYVSTSWFLVDSKNSKKEKIISLILDTSIISLVFLVIYVIAGYQVSRDDLLWSLLPITNLSYWYVTCYILLYAIHPCLNIMLDNISRKKHFNLCLGSFILYFLFLYFTQMYLNTNEMYINKLGSFIIVYIIISYFKKYKLDLCENIKKQILIFLISGGLFYFILFINFAIYPIKIRWHEMYNPFFLCMTFSLVNIFRKINIKNSFINLLSGLSLYVYVIHGNLFVLDGTINKIISYFLSFAGVDYIFIKVFFVALLVFVLSMILAFLYNVILKKVINKCSNKIVKYIRLFVACLYSKFGE